MAPAYGILISLGVFASLLVCERLVPKKQRDTLWGLTFWAIVGGILGARAYHVLDFWTYYKNDPLQILYIWRGGLGVLGAIAGAFLAILIYSILQRDSRIAASHRLHLIYWLDIFSVGAPLAQAVGRWGNFFNNELFGKPTSLSWGLYVPESERPTAYINSNHFHPLFLYESTLTFALFLALFYLVYVRKIRPGGGTLTRMYLAGYGVIRFWLEFLRINPWNISGINVAQFMSTLMVTLALGWEMYNRVQLKRGVHSVGSSGV